MTSWIEIDYTGRVDGVVFDTTQETNKTPGMQGPFTPAVVKLGSGQLLKGLDSFLADKKPGKYEITLAPAEAFGNKDTSRLKLVPLSTFGKDAKKLETGMSVTIGDTRGVVKSISGGRVVVDFNHPLAGKTVVYSVEHKGSVTDPVKKVQATVRGMLGVDLPVKKDGENIVVTVPSGFPVDHLVKHIQEYSGETVKTHAVVLPKHQHMHADGTIHDNSAHKH